MDASKEIHKIAWSDFELPKAGPEGARAGMTCMEALMSREVGYRERLAQVNLATPTNKSTINKTLATTVDAASKKWTMAIHHWKQALNRFMIEFEEQIAPHL